MTTFQLRLLLGSEHNCSYLPARAARSAFIDPGWQLDPARYGLLLALGFRRSGTFVYRPACSGCVECRPVRVPVADFRPTRAQRRCLRDNGDLELEVGERLGEEQYLLYRRYLRARHADGGMNPDDRNAFHAFLECAWGQVEFLNFRRKGRLLATAVVDRVPEACSAVYTFYDPEERERSLGTYAVLRQIERARQLGLAHVYLGYWVRESPKMHYKSRFRPLEVLQGRDWKRCEEDAPDAVG